MLPKKYKKTTMAKGVLCKGTHNSLVFSSAMGPSLYFNRGVFEGDEPVEVEIQITWLSEKAPQTHNNTNQGE